MSTIPSELIVALDTLRISDSVSAIPSELIAAIVDELKHDRASLKSCSVVAVPFCAPSQRHLFRTMWLHRENWKFYTALQQKLHEGTTIPSGTIKRLSSLLLESPHLAQYIRDLTIDLPDSADEDIPLAHILQEVPNIERLVISGLGVHWNDLSQAVASTILDVFARPSLKGLHLLNIQHLPEAAVLRVLSSMEVLSLHNSTVNVGETVEHATRTVSNLDHLILSRNPPSTYDFILSSCTPKLGNVRKLRLDTSHFTFERTLSSVATTLVDLELRCDQLNFPFDLPSLPQLRSLMLRIFPGISRRIPGGLPGGQWVEEGQLLTQDDCQLEAIHCRLLFLDPRLTKALTRDTAFDSFCVAMRAAMVGLQLEFSRVDEEQSYIGRLP
ncbi:hypothetical protein B0H14DRAFT_2759319 [Mycena olivaceomarginata]|nr:hypothetical protein B0H14DRAFT_2759319 [Mycena olivaceomarginata]